MGQTALTYLASPFTHPDERIKRLRYLAVNLTAVDLIKQGRTIYSPLTHNVALIDLGLQQTWEFWEKHDKKLLSVCDNLIVLQMDGWETSTGVQAEIEIAKQLNLEIDYLEPSVDIIAKAKQLVEREYNEQLQMS